MDQEGSDPYGAKLRGSGRDILTLPARYKQLVTGPLVMAVLTIFGLLSALMATGV